MTKHSNVAAAGVSILVLMAFAMFVLTSTPGKIVIQAADGASAYSHPLSVEDLTNPYFATEFGCDNPCNLAK